MTDLPALRRYDEEEIRSLLTRAAELQRAAPPTSPTPTGLTLAELEEIAGEAGLDSSLLRRAASELDQAGRTQPVGFGERLAGAPVRVVLEHTLPFEADKSAFDGLVPLIETASKRPGQARQTGNRFGWSSRTETDPSGVKVMVMVRSGETLIRVEERFDGLAWGLFGGAVGGGVGVGGAGAAIAVTLGSVGLGIAVPATILVGLVTGARAIFRTAVNRRRPRLDDLLADIVEELTRTRPDG